MFFLLVFLLLWGCGSDPARNIDPIHLSFDADGVGSLLLQGENLGDEYGKSVAWVADLNGDGFSDIVIGAPAAAGGGLERGTVYVFFGGRTMDNFSDAVISGERDFDHFGTALADAGDMDGDGFGDFWVGAPDTLNDGITRSNTVYLFRGGPALTGTFSAAAASVRLPSQGGPGSGFGVSLATLDVDGDGRRDLLVGAPFNGVAGVKSGIVYLLTQFNGTGFAQTIQIPGPNANGLFGYSVVNVGHINDGTRDDFAVGAPTTPSLNPDGTPTGKGCTGAGDVYLFFGRIGTDYSTPDRIMSGQNSNVDLEECFGFALSSGGDLDGDDGVPDLAVGAPRTTPGSVYLFKGSTLRDATANPVSADQLLNGETLGEFFGSALGGFFDRGGDGKLSLPVGAYNRDLVGAVDLFDGGALPIGPKVRSFRGGVANGYFGLTIGAGGIGGKGLLIGAPVAGAGEVQVLVFGF
jgi:hypothetical protein